MGVTTIIVTSLKGERGLRSIQEGKVYFYRGVAAEIFGKVF